MMRWRRIGLIVAIAGLFVLGWWAGRGRAEGTRLYEGFDLFVEVLHRVEDNYVDPVDAEKLIGGAISGVTRELDPFSQYLNDPAYANLQSAIKGVLGGIGVEVGVRDNFPTVIAPIEGTPASRAGVQMGDVITKIDGQSTAGFTLEDVSARLRGEKGTQVTITVEREREPGRDITLTRDIIVTRSVPYAFMTKERVGYVRLANFSEHSGTDVRRALGKLAAQGARSLILDLRSNPGGLLNQAVSVAEEFLPRGTLVVQTRGRGEGQDTRLVATEARPRLDWPVAVLVDEGTASASEIVAGALQDLDRGLVVGERTYGKGSVQRIFPLRDGHSGLKLTTALYYTPSGRSIHRRTPAPQDDSDDDVRSPAPADTTTPVYRTKAGRKVLGGGGIVPDVAVAPDSLPPLTRQAEAHGLPFRFASRYAAHVPGAIPAGKPTPELWQEFANFLVQEKVTTSAAALEPERARLECSLQRELARRAGGDSAAARVMLADDPVYLRAVAVLGKSSRPQDVFAQVKVR